MLTLTNEAATEVRRLTDQTEEPASSGLRIAGDNSGSLLLSLAEAPVAGDAVVDNSGARVFLDTEAATVLDDKTLDVAVDGDGQVQFALAEQPQ